MEEKYFCSKLHQNIDLSHDRKMHILKRHAELKDFVTELELTITNPEFILIKSTGELLLIRWFQHVINGKFIVAVVINDEMKLRKWVVTAFVSRKCPVGELYE